MIRPDYIDLDIRARRARIEPREPAFVQDPYPAYSFLQETAPVFFWENYGMWCSTRFDDVNRLLRDRRLGRERPGGYAAAVAGSGDRAHLARFDAVEAGSLLELEPPAHTRLRTLVNRAFVSRQIERLRPRIEALAHSLIDVFASDSRADLLPAFATPLPAIVITEMMGLPPESAQRLVAWSNAMVRMYMHAPSRDDELRADAAAGAFAAFIHEQARNRQATPGDDLLGVLVSAREAGDRLRENELVSSAILLLNAGHEATVHQIGNAVRTILDQGGDPRRFFATQEDSKATVEECLRFDAPLHMFTRIAYETVEIAPGVTLEPGEQVGLLLGAANRDSAVFEEATQFRPGRDDQRNVSFGAGIHFCVGAPLARLELQVALRVLFERLPRMRIVEPSPYRDSYHFHGLERLIVEW